MSQTQFPTESQQSSQRTDAGQSQQGMQVQQQQAQQTPQQSQQPTQQQAGQLYPTKNFLSQSVRTASITALNQSLADLTAVTMQCKTAHWNVRGPNFYQLHELFEDVVEALEPLVDTVAERATALGGQAQGTAPVVAQQANVPRLSPTTSDEQQLLQQVATSLATVDQTLYQEINRVSEQGDLDTADLLNEVSRAVSKSLWFVEAHLQTQGTNQQQGYQASSGQGVQVGQQQGGQAGQQSQTAFQQ